MNDHQIELLKSLVNGNKEAVVYWWSDSNESPKKVTHVGQAPNPKDDDEPEPSYVAYLKDGSYVALYNCELSDFCFISRI